MRSVAKSDEYHRHRHWPQLQIQVGIKTFFLGKVLDRHLLKLTRVVRHRAAELHSQNEDQQKKEFLVPELNHVQGLRLGRANLAVQHRWKTRDRQKINTDRLLIHFGLTFTTTLLLAGVPLLYAFN